MVMDKEFRGNAYIVKAGEVLLNYSGGFADLANEIPNTIDTRFASASMGKTFVAVGILQLIEEERYAYYLNELYKTVKIHQEMQKKTEEIFNLNKADFLGRNRVVLLSSGPNFGTASPSGSCRLAVGTPSFRPNALP